MRQKPPPTVPPLEAASGGGLKVISYNEWPVDEKDRLHEFLVSNDIQFKLNSSGSAYEAVVRMVREGDSSSSSAAVASRRHRQSNATDSTAKATANKQPPARNVKEKVTQVKATQPRTKPHTSKLNTSTPWAIMKPPPSKQQQQQESSSTRKGKDQQHQHLLTNNQEGLVIRTQSSSVDQSSASMNSSMKTVVMKQQQQPPPPKQQQRQSSQSICSPTQSQTSFGKHKNRLSEISFSNPTHAPIKSREGGEGITATAENPAEASLPPPPPEQLTAVVSPKPVRLTESELSMNNRLNNGSSAMRTPTTARLTQRSKISGGWSGSSDFSLNNRLPPSGSTRAISPKRVVNDFSEDQHLHQGKRSISNTIGSLSPSLSSPQSKSVVNRQGRLNYSSQLIKLESVAAGGGPLPSTKQPPSSSSNNSQEVNVKKLSTFELIHYYKFLAMKAQKQVKGAS